MPAFLLCPQWQTMRETASPLVSPLIKTLILNLIVSLNPSSSDTIALEVRASAYDFVGNTIQCTAIVILKYTWLTAMWPYILSSRSTCWMPVASVLLCCAYCMLFVINYGEGIYFKRRRSDSAVLGVKPGSVNEGQWQCWRVLSSPN